MSAEEPAQTREAFEARLRGMERFYHIHHPFHLAMNEGGLDAEAALQAGPAAAVGSPQAAAADGEAEVGGDLPPPENGAHGQGPAAVDVITYEGEGELGASAEADGAAGTSSMDEGSLPAREEGGRWCC